MAPNSTPLRCVVSLPPVGILNLLCSICIVFVCYAHLNIFTWNLRDINVYYYYFVIIKLKHYASKATVISVYYSLIYPYVTYACTLWGNNYNAPLSQIVKLQNKAVRVINDVPMMESITRHNTSLGLLKFPDIVKLNTCAFL